MALSRVDAPAPAAFPSPIIHETVVMSQPIRLMHVITGLRRGGAEMMLYKLLLATDRSRFSSSVVSLTDEGNVGGMIRALGVPVTALGMSPRFPNPAVVLRLATLLRGGGIQAVQCWMYHADLVGGLAAWLGGVPVIWGIRQSNFDMMSSKRSTVRIMKWCARLSARVPSKIVACSQTARRLHQGYGYSEGKMVVIPNGFQTDVFMPDEQAGGEVRRQLGIPEDAAVVGVVGRFDPQKDHQSFITAAGELARRVDLVYFLFCGDGLRADNRQLAGWIAGQGIEDRCKLLGRRDDLHRIYCAMDIMVSSSAYGEGFPNVIGEAMSCGVPCVVTDVGDSALMVGDTGRVVPPRDAVGLSTALLDLLGLPAEKRRELGAAARRRIVEHYDLPSVADRYMALYQDVVTQCAG